MNLKRILNHESVFNFWKPKEDGEKIFGKLLSILLTQNGRVLQIETSDGDIKHVGVSTVLENVLWESYVGKAVQIIYAGTVVSKSGRSYMTFDVDVEQ